MKIAVTGGKLLLDADVDCPDDDIILGIEVKKLENVKTMTPKFDFNKCIKCGICSEVCRENAIVFVKEKYPILVPEQCTGCKACKIACPVSAISEANQAIGEIFVGKKGNITLISGKMRTGIEESSLVVNAVKKFAKQKEKNYDYIIIDTAAGTHCPVIAAILNVDVGIAVTEPTPLDNHDLNLILELMEKLKVKLYIALNRSDIANKKMIEKTARKYKKKIIAEIPCSKEIEGDYSVGKPIEHPAIQKIVERLK